MLRPASDSGEQRPVLERDAPPDLPSGTPATFDDGRYRVLRAIGEGGRKRVFLAHDRRLDREVALAVVKHERLDQTGRLRVMREVRTMARLGDHPHVATVYDVCEESGSPAYFVTPYFSGGSLAALLAASAGRRLPVERCLALAEQVARGLTYAHSHGVLHRDLKPGNVWLTEDGTAKLGDFGLAVPLDPEVTRLTGEGIVLGTVAYMPPEQALGGPPDARSDLYSLGAMLYEMLVGRPPFVGEQLFAVLSQHLNAMPVAPSRHDPRVPANLDRLVLQLLAKNPEDRPQSAADVCAALHAVAAGVAEDPPTYDGPSHPLDRLTDGLFLGREEVMARLHPTLEQAVAGRLRLVMLTGEPGIGKTRTAEELATYARIRGFEILWGRCHEGEGAPAYWPWVQILRSCAQGRDPKELERALGGGAASVAELVSEIREALPHLASPPSLDPEQARFRLFDAIARFLRQAARTRPLLVVLDDLHWSDRASLRLLQFVSRQVSEARILVVGTYRDVALPKEHPLAQTLGDLVPIAERIELKAFAPADVREYVEKTTGVAPSDTLAQAVYARSEGNPFFLTELVRLLATDTRLDRSEEVRAWTPGIPSGIREAVGRRLSGLSPSCNSLLEIASAAGRIFELAIVEQVAGLDRARALDLLDEARAARLVHEQAGARGVYAFAHALVRDALYEELPAARRAAVHGDIALAIEEIHANRLDGQAAALAQHYLEASLAGGGDEKAIDYATRAGRHARRVLAYEEAAQHYESALDLVLRSNRSEFLLRAELGLALAEALLCAGQRSGAHAAFAQAAAVARELGDSDLVGEAALGVARSTIKLGGDAASSIALLEEALGGLGEEDSPLRVRILACLATASSWSPDGRRRDLGLAAVEMARRLGDPATLATALSAARFGAPEPGESRSRLASAREIVTLAGRVGDAEIALQGRVWVITSLLETGEVAAADVEIEACERAATALRQPAYRAFAVGWKAARAILTGAFDEAERWLESGKELARRADERTALMSLGAQELLLRSEQGRLEEVEAVLAAFRGQAPNMPAWQIGLANLYAHLGRHAEARVLFEQVAVHEFRDLPRDLTWLASVVLLADVAALLHDRPRAALLYALLSPYAADYVVLSTSVCLGSPHHHLGLLAGCLDRRDEAAAHFEEALAANQRIGALPRCAHAQRAYAEMLLARGHPGDREAAIARIDAAAAIAEPLGMKLLTDGLESLRRRIEIGRAAIGPSAIARGAVGATPAGAGAFRREGEYWTLIYAGQLVRLKETRGFHYIARLLREPGCEVACGELAGDGVAATAPGRTRGLLGSPDAGVAVAASLGDAGAPLDAQAKAEYRRRLHELRAELAEAEEFNDSGRAERAREEIELVGRQLRAAVGLGGRDRKVRSHGERLRVRITQAIRAALRKIERGHPSLGRHLAASIRTGYRCAYRPDPAVAISWEL